MAAITKLEKLQARLEREKAKQAARRARTPKAYTPKKEGDTTTVWIPDITGKVDYVEYQANAEALRLLTPGMAGVLTARPAADKSVVQWQKKSKIPLLIVKWYSGTDTPTAQRTEWGTRWIKRYKNNGSQAFYSCPFAAKTAGENAKYTLEAAIDAFKGVFDPDNGSKKALLGTGGGASLWLGEQKLVGYE